MDRVVKTVLDSMSTLNKPQKTFMALLLSTLVVVQGKANFRNMSRYCEMSENVSVGGIAALLSSCNSMCS